MSHVPTTTVQENDTSQLWVTQALDSKFVWANQVIDSKIVWVNQAIGDLQNSKIVWVSVQMKIMD